MNFKGLVVDFSDVGNNSAAIEKMDELYITSVAGKVATLFILSPIHRFDLLITDPIILKFRYWGTFDLLPYGPKVPLDSFKRLKVTESILKELE